MFTKRTLKQGGIAKTDRVDEKFFYVDNDLFYAAIKEYLVKREAAVAAGEDIPIIPDFIGSCFFKIASFMSRKSNFVSYSFRDEMVSDAVLNMCTYIHKFNHNAHTNPFSYFMQSCFYSFLLRIKKEKKESVVKAHIAANLGTLLDDVALELQDSDDPNYKSAAVELLQMRSSDILRGHNEAKEKLKMKKKKKLKSIEDLMSEPSIEIIHVASILDWPLPNEESEIEHE